MASPYAQLFSGLRMNTPGVSVGPSSGMPYASPSINGVEWQPRGMEGGGELATALNFGQSSGENTVQSQQADGKIAHQYVSIPWGDGSHLRVAEYQLVFIARDFGAHDQSAYTTLTIAKLNEVLRSSYLLYEEMLAEKDNDATNFRKLLDKYGEDMMESYIRSKDKSGFDNTAKNDLAQLVALIQKPVFRNLTKYSILTKWNFVGAVLSVNRATGVNEIDDMEQSEHVNVLNLAIGKRAFIHNLLGDRTSAATGGDSWLVLTRATRRNNGAAGPFYFSAYASRTHIFPPRSRRQYYDGRNKPRKNYNTNSTNTSWRITDGHVIPLGVITKPPSRDMPPNLTDLALGLDVSHKEAFEHTAALPVVQVQLGI